MNVNRVKWTVSLQELINSGTLSDKQNANLLRLYIGKERQCYWIKSSCHVYSWNIRASAFRRIVWYHTKPCGLLLPRCFANRLIQSRLIVNWMQIILKTIVTHSFFRDRVIAGRKDVKSAILDVIIYDNTTQHENGTACSTSILVGQQHVLQKTSSR